MRVKSKVYNGTAVHKYALFKVKWGVNFLFAYDTAVAGTYLQTEINGDQVTV